LVICRRIRGKKEKAHAKLAYLASHSRLHQNRYPLVETVTEKQNGKREAAILLFGRLECCEPKMERNKRKRAGGGGTTRKQVRCTQRSWLGLGPLSSPYKKGEGGNRTTQRKWPEGETKGGTRGGGMNGLRPPLAIADKREL